MTTFETERLGEIKQQVADALQSDGFDFDVERYAKLDAAGALRVFSARDGDKLLGFIIFTVATHPHHRTELWGFVDKVWIDEAVRMADFQGWSVAVHLLAHASTSLGREGVVAIRGAASADEEGAYRALGYEAVEVIFSKSTTVVFDA